MIEVTFTSYPKDGKKLFKTGIFKQKPLPLKEANDRVKEYAKTLSAHETKEFAFTVIKDDGGDVADEYTFDTQIEAGDAQFGIVSLISRDYADEELSDEENEDLEDLQDQIQSELGAAKTNYADELEPEETDKTAVEENTDNQPVFQSQRASGVVGDIKGVEGVDGNIVKQFSMVDTPKQTQPKANNSNEESQSFEDNESLPLEDSLPEPESVSNENNDIQPTDDLDLPDPTSEFAAQNQERAAPAQPAPVPTELVVTPSSKFENPEDILSKIPDKYNAESFDLSVIKAQLGYKNNPTDKFDEELNRTIDEVLKDTGLSSLQSEFDITKSNLENSLIDALTTKYNELTKNTVENIVAVRLKDEINQLEQDAQNNKQKNQSNMEQACNNEEARLTAQDVDKLDQFKVQLQNEHQESMRSFKINQQKELDTLNEKIDTRLADSKNDLKQREHDKVVNEINRNLSDTRVELSNRFNQGLKNEFTKSEENFRVGLDGAISSIQEKRDEINQKREKYQFAQAKLAQKQKENELKARELDQKEQELALTKKQIEGLPDAIAAAINKTQQQSPNSQLMPFYQVPGNYYYAQPAGAPQIPNNSTPPVDNTEFQKLKDQYDALEKKLTEVQITAKDKEIEDAKKELATTKNSKKHWQIGIISFLAVATLSSVLLFGYNRNNHSVSSTKPSVVLVKNSSAEKSNKKTSSPKKQDTSSKKKLEQPSTPKPETPEQKYNSLNNWSEKVDYLNGLVGQKDVRSLEVINRNDPTTLSKLYLAIAQNNQKDIRDSWLKMNADERRNVSDSARDSVILAFYAVHDWQNGWLAKNES